MCQQQNDIFMFQEAVGLERRRCWRSLLPNFNLHRFKTTPWPQSIIFYISYIVLTYRFKTSYFTHLPFWNCKLQQQIKSFAFLFVLEQDSSEPNWLLPNVSSASFFTTFRPDYSWLFFFQTNIKKMRCSYSKRRDKLATVVKTGSGLS